MPVPRAPILAAVTLLGLPALALAPASGFSGTSGFEAIPLSGGADCETGPAAELFELDSGLPIPIPFEEDVNEASRVPPTVCSGIRPGVRLTAPAGCTLNFVFRDVATAKLYVGSAGHCFDKLGQAVETGPLGVIGRVAYFVDAGYGRDFGLVEILPSMYGHVNPSLCHWGGPIGVYADDESTLVRHYGNGMVYGAVFAARPRTGWAYDWDSTGFSALGASSKGDSGSAVLTEDGLAGGILTHGIPAAGAFSGTRVDRAIGLVHAATGIRLEVVTAPLA